MHTLSVPPGKKVYFASDFHLGMPNGEASKTRERQIISWLRHIEQDSAALFLVGDIFDFWFEYKNVIPKGFLRFQAEVARLADEGMPIYWFTGNHDMWIFDYIPSELGITLFREPQVFLINNKKLLIGHGDGLGPGDRKYKILKNFFASRFCQRLFAMLHPAVGMGIATAWSGRSRASHADEEVFESKEKEWLWVWSCEQEQKAHHDYYIFGHRHLPLDIEVGPVSRYINLGQWFSGQSYAVMEGDQLKLITNENAA